MVYTYFSISLQMNHLRHDQKQSFWVADLTGLFLGSERMMPQAHFLKSEMKRFIHIPQCISHSQVLEMSTQHQKGLQMVLHFL